VVHGHVLPAVRAVGHELPRGLLASWCLAFACAQHVPEAEGVDGVEHGVRQIYVEIAAQDLQHALAPARRLPTLDVGLQHARQA
jgi:hypothetical protein